MSIKARLKPHLQDTLLWNAAHQVKEFPHRCLSYACIFGSFCLGWCSYAKMRAFFSEYSRRERIVKLQAKGIDSSPATYNGKRILDREEANSVIASAIEAGKPFMAGRYGDIELSVFWRVREDNKGFVAPVQRARRGFCSNAGFFPDDKKEFIKFAKLMQEATHEVNLMGVWFNPMEEYILRTYGNNPQYTRLGYLEPILASNPWSAKLEGKKVLVVHPFKDTILLQYKKRELLFPGKNMLPEFQLRVVRAVQTIAGNRDERFNTWFEALDYMYNEAIREDFDVAIIGCGAYGFPLAAKIKQAGKIVIHLGGATQLLFGIKGRRWEKYKGELHEMLKNPAWVRPKEKPKDFETIEEGCYW